MASETTRRRYWARSFAGWQQFVSVPANGAHEGLARLQRRGWIACLLTQNVDRLHQKAGARDVLEIHGTTHMCAAPSQPTNLGYRPDGVVHCLCTAMRYCRPRPASSCGTQQSGAALERPRTAWPHRVCVPSGPAEATRCTCAWYMHSGIAFLLLPWPCDPQLVCERPAMSLIAMLPSVPAPRLEVSGAALRSELRVQSALHALRLGGEPLRLPGRTRGAQPLVRCAPEHAGRGAVLRNRSRASCFVHAQLPQRC